MLRLVKYLKPYTLLIVLNIALLFAQANADLALPDYLSKIVNVGIQQGGIENAVPQAILKSELEKLFVFMSAPDQATVHANYTLIDQKSPDYAQYIKLYPALAEAPVYVLNKIDRAQMNQLNAIMGRPMLIVYYLEQAAADPTQAANFAGQMGFDLSQIPAGMDPFTVLKQLPADQFSRLATSINQRFTNMLESVLSQAAVKAVSAQYALLGMNITLLQTRYILQIGAVMLLLTLLSGVCAVGVGLLSARTAAGMARDVRRGLFQHVESFSSAEIDKFSTASLITRSTNDITQVQNVVMMIMRMVFYAPIIAIGGVIRAMGKSTSMWWILALAVVIILSLIITIFSISLPKFKVIQKMIDRLNLVMRENLSGMLVIRAFDMQTFEEGRFDIANKDLTDTMLFVNRIMVVMMPAMMLVMNCTTVLILWVGSHAVAAMQMQVGDMMAFMQYAMLILFSFLMLSMMFIIIPRASVSGDRIADVLVTEPSIKDPEQPKQFPDPFTGAIEFRNVNFRYPDAEEDILHNISFTALPGQTTAFMGTTGSGKSTIVSLIPRFYEVVNGGIYIDDVNIRDVTQHDLRDKIGYVPQKSSLFSGTIETNLLFADEQASDQTLELAINIAQASEFVHEREDGIRAEIAQGGMNVSGGQKQRLAIARALVKQPPIYIFDDSFSALDYRTDSALRRALKQQTSSSTLLIVTQRIATIKDAEQIIVLDEGRIVGKGTHQSLMQDCEVYRSIAMSQLSAEELA